MPRATPPSGNRYRCRCHSAPAAIPWGGRDATGSGARRFTVASSSERNNPIFSSVSVRLRHGAAPGNSLHRTCAFRYARYPFGRESVACGSGPTGPHIVRAGGFCVRRGMLTISDGCDHHRRWDRWIGAGIGAARIGGGAPYSRVRCRRRNAGARHRHSHRRPCDEGVERARARGRAGRDRLPARLRFFTRNGQLVYRGFSARRRPPVAAYLSGAPTCSKAAGARTDRSKFHWPRCTGVEQSADASPPVCRSWARHCRGDGRRVDRLRWHSFRRSEVAIRRVLLSRLNQWRGTSGGSRFSLAPASRDRSAASDDDHLSARNNTDVDGTLNWVREIERDVAAQWNAGASGRLLFRIGLD